MRKIILMLLSLLMVSLLISGCTPKQAVEETAEEQGTSEASVKAVSDLEIETDLQKLSLSDLDELIKVGEAAKDKPLSEQAYNNPDWLTLAYKVKADKLAESTGSGSSSVANHAPVFKSLSNQDGVENGEIMFTVSATDEDGDILTYDVKNDPPGADFSSKSGKFSWTPGYDNA